MSLTKKGNGPLWISYRPEKLDEMAATFDVEGLRQHIIQPDHSHSYFISGDYGLGKTTLARIVAKFFNCLRPANGNPCGTCDNCKDAEIKIREENMADRTKIADTRDMIQELYQEPYDGSKKVVILDECHRLTNSAQHAWLKITEDVPEHLYIIFCTMEPDKVVRALRQRCHSIYMRPMTKHIAKEFMGDIMEKEEILGGEDLMEDLYSSIGGVPRALLNALHELRDRGDFEIEKKRQEETETKLNPFIIGMLNSDSWGKLVRMYHSLVEHKSGNVEGFRVSAGTYLYKMLLGGNMPNGISHAGTKLMILIDALSNPINSPGEEFALCSRLFQAWKNIRDFKPQKT